MMMEWIAYTQEKIYAIFVQDGRTFWIFQFLMSFIIIGALVGTWETLKISLCLASLVLVPQPSTFLTMMVTLVATLWLLPFIFRSYDFTARYNYGQPFTECLNAMDGMRKGDIIEFERTILPEWTGSIRHSPMFSKMYSHWGIYYDHGSLYHLVTHDNGLSTIEFDQLDKVAAGQRCRVNNLEKVAASYKLKRKSALEIIKAARTALHSSESIPYELIKYNCEHFVTECVYGQSFSIPADEAYTFWTKYYFWYHWVFFVIYMGIYHAYRELPTVRNTINEMYMSVAAWEFWNSWPVELVTNILSAIEYEVQHNYTRFIIEGTVLYICIFYGWALYCERVVANEE